MAEIDLSGIEPTLAPQNTTARKFAEMLMSQNQPVQGQMISGRYVKPSIFQQLQPVANMLTGAYLSNKADEQAQQYADLVRKIGAKETADILGTAQGSQVELAGPAYQGVAPSIQYPGDTKAALAKALMAQTPQGKSLAAPLMQNLLPKKTNELINYEAAKEGGFKGTFDEWRNQLTPYQKEELKLQNQRLGIEFANANKPQIVETANGFVAVNPRNPTQAVPVMFNGQIVTGTKGNLPEGAAGQVTGVQNVKSALKDLKNNLQNFSTLDMLNPNKRAIMSTDYENTILQLKEAMKLGVLNGNDYTILTSMITDPNSPKALLLDKKTQMQQIENVSKKLDEMTKNVYETHQKTVPANLKSEAPATTTQTTIKPTLKYNLATGQWE